MTLTEERQRVKAILKEWNIVSEVLTSPIVYHPGGWEDTLPEHIKQKVLEQRIEMVLNGGWDVATDAEVVCYLYTACLVQPFTSDWTDIYLYEAATLMPQVRQAVPATPTELSDYQKSELRDLKRKIRDSQKRRRKSKRKEKDMSKRKLVMEEHEGNVLVGIMQDQCDPVIRTVEGTLDDALAVAPDFLKEAQEKWAVSPKNPTYTPPAAPKPAVTPAAATTPAQKAEDLPLLSGTEKPQPAEAVEVAAEEKAPEAEVEITEPQAEKVEQEISERIAEAPAPTEAQAEVEVKPEEFPAEVRREAEAVAAEVAKEAAPSAAAKPGEYEYYLQDGRGPFKSVQAAMDELGLDKNTRPSHNRWDRLSTSLKQRIQRRPKA